MSGFIVVSTEKIYQLDSCLTFFWFHIYVDFYDSSTTSMFDVTMLKGWNLDNFNMCRWHRRNAKKRQHFGFHSFLDVPTFLFHQSYPYPCIGGVVLQCGDLSHHWIWSCLLAQLRISNTKPVRREGSPKKVALKNGQDLSQSMPNGSLLVICCSLHYESHCDEFSNTSQVLPCSMFSDCCWDIFWLQHLSYELCD